MLQFFFFPFSKVRRSFSELCQRQCRSAPVILAAFFRWLRRKNKAGARSIARRGNKGGVLACRPEADFRLQICPSDLSGLNPSDFDGRKANCRTAGARSLARWRNIKGDLLACRREVVFRLHICLGAVRRCQERGARSAPAHLARVWTGRNAPAHLDRI